MMMYMYIDHLKISSSRSRPILDLITILSRLPCLPGCAPGLAGYYIHYVVFAVGHAGTVPKCTVDAVRAIPVPSDEANVLMRAVIATVSKHNANIVQARYGRHF